MTFARLALRGVVHRWRALALLGSASAVASAVVVGSLVVGDSVRSSLRQIALGRLGDTHLAVSTPRHFRAGLADELHGSLSGRAPVAALWLAPAAAYAPGSGTTAADAHVVGVDEGFAQIAWPGVAPLPHGRSAVVGPVLARDLGLRVGDEVLLTVARPGLAAHHTLFARRGRGDAAVTLRLEVGSIAPDVQAAQYALDGNPATRRNVFVDRRTLTAALGRPDVANTLVLGGGASREEVVAALREVARPEDLGLTVRVVGASVTIGSSAVALREPEVGTVVSAAEQAGAALERVSVNLATGVRNERTGGEAAYAVVAFVEGAAAPAANDWVARDIGARSGDALLLRYLVPRPDGGYATRETRVLLGAVAPMRGDAANPALAPEFEGVTAARRIADWDPPFPVDKSRVTARDEEYWRLYRAAPRLLLPESVLREMWSPEGAAPSDWITGLRLRPRDGDAGALAAAMTAALGRSAAAPGSLVAVRDVRESVLRSAQGSTEFSGLFLGLGIVLIIASLHLTQLLMRLQCDRRAREVGLLLAVGMRPRAVRALLVVEGAVAAAAGSVAGAVGGVAYAAWVVGLLRTQWLDAIRVEHLALDVAPGTVMAGVAVGIVLGLLSLAAGSAAVVRRSAVGLLRGAHPEASACRRSGRRLAPAVLLCVLGLSFVAAGSARWVDPVGAFFGGGACLLAAGLAAGRALLAASLRADGAAPSVWRLARRNAAIHGGHSLAVAATVAASAFVVVAVAANVRDAGALDTSARDSGSGGFELVAVSAVPLPNGMDTPAGRRALGFTPEEELALSGATVVAMSMAEGDDVSCLNVSRPVQPRLIGVPQALMQRGGFRLATARGAADGWEALTQRAAEGEVPAFGDAASVQWTLRSGLGGTVPAQDGSGTERALRITGVLPGSIFAGELLVSAENLMGMFPAAGGPRYFLIDAPDGQADATASALRRAVGDLGVSVRTTREVLADFGSVQNTYLAMFGVLGGLGVLLGTLGLATVVARNAVERRQELAVLTALGFRRSSLALLLAAEHAALLMGGLALGAASALVAVLPQVAAMGVGAHWGAVVAWLIGIGATGLVACAAGGALSVRGRLIDALRSE
ncbi:MAG TPA: FtsX-like permease family protein [Chthonomonadales bacterium]|nr:FtsX-like permease family protein [Chthonomonadales bacterium]